jgi:hypothetical protein
LLLTSGAGVLGSSYSRSLSPSYASRKGFNSSLYFWAHWNEIYTSAISRIFELNFSGKTNFIDLSVLLNKSNRNIRSFELNLSGKTNFIDLSVMLSKSNQNIRSFELNFSGKINFIDLSVMLNKSNRSNKFNSKLRIFRFDLFKSTDKSIKLVFPEKFNSKLRIFRFDLLNITDKSIKLVFPEKFNSKLRIFRFDLFQINNKSMKLVFPRNSTQNSGYFGLICSTLLINR